MVIAILVGLSAISAWMTSSHWNPARAGGQGLAATSDSLPPPLSKLLVYSVKIVCVPHLGPASPALMPGKYRTAVNVHNPSDEPADIEKWVTLSNP